MATVLSLGVFAPALAFAQTTSTTSASTLVGQIQTLQTQINSLQQQQQQYMATLQMTLKQGSTGEQVAVLQALLAADSSIYPEGIVSGFFGRLTGEAVKRFQKKNGIEQVGFVGPKTLKRLQEHLKERPLAFDNATSTKKMHGEDKRDKKEEKREKKNEDRRPCAIVPPGHLIAPGWLKKHKGEDRQVVPECQKLPKGIKDLLDRDHGDDDDDNGTTTPPVADTTAPVISTISTSNIGTASASISWLTNESATSKVYFSTTTPVNLSTSLTVSNNSLVMSRTLNLTGLASSTTYYYVIESKDAALNTSTTSTQSFVTAAPPVADTLAPVISAISTSNISSTTVMISWLTNEPSTSKIYYATTTPVNLGTALVVSNNSLVASHSLGFTGLASSTLYYYVLESVDAASNTATTTTQSFATTN